MEHGMVSVHTSVCFLLNSNLCWQQQHWAAILIWHLGSWLNAENCVYNFKRHLGRLASPICIPHMPCFGNVITV